MFAIITSHWTPIKTDLKQRKKDWKKMTNHQILKKLGKCVLNIEAKCICVDATVVSLFICSREHLQTLKRCTHTVGYTELSLFFRPSASITGLRPWNADKKNTL